MDVQSRVPKQQYRSRGKNVDQCGFVRARNSSTVAKGKHQDATVATKRKAKNVVIVSKRLVAPTIIIPSQGIPAIIRHGQTKIDEKEVCQRTHAAQSRVASRTWQHLHATLLLVIEDLVYLLNRVNKRSLFCNAIHKIDFCLGQSCVCVS